nr:MAG TPA: helix-turn-helix domain protein [Bacteriophage sp.]
MRKASVTDEQIHAICKSLENGERIADISRSLNVSRNIIANIKCGDHSRISQFYNFKRNKNSRKKN